MKTKQELLSMLFRRLAELQDGRAKKNNPEYAKQLQAELSLLHDILGDEIEENYEEYWEQLEEEEMWYPEEN